MRRSVKVHQTLEVLYGEEYVEGEPLSTSPSEDSNDDDDDATNPTFVTGDSSDEKNEPSTQRPSGRGCKRKRRTRSRARSQDPLESLKSGNNTDTAPKVSRFMPQRTPGAQLLTLGTYSPLDLFKLYFSPTTVLTLCQNTNKYAAKNSEMGKKYEWVDVDADDFYKFTGLLTYTSLVKLQSIRDYWKKNGITSLPFPSTIMSRDRFMTLLWNIHPSDPDEANKNEEKKGTPAYNRLFRVKPLIDNIRTACQANYHPRKELTVDERMMTNKVQIGTIKFMKDKPPKWGIKLFVLTDSSNGYTINFNIYMEKTHTHTVHGLSYDAVMDLIQPSYLGTGYYVSMDSIYTSPQLLLDLAEMKFYTNKTYRDKKRFDCPSPSITNTNIVGVDMSDQLKYFSTHRRTARWYRTFFLHLLDIATTNAFILHSEISASKKVKPMSRKDFQTELVSQLCGVDSKGFPTNRDVEHIPVAIAEVTDSSKKASQGRRTCRQCNLEKKRNTTPWKCKSCDVALCLILDRNCFEKWHK